jgi:hypothetical protein
MQYYVVYRESLEELIKEVNRLIGEGWRPQGGVGVGAASLGGGFLERAIYVFAQTVIRETK